MALINTLRKRMGKIVVGVVAFSMFAFILTDLLNSNSALLGTSQEVGTVAGQDITYEQFNDKVNQLSTTFALNNGRNPLNDEMDQIREQAWQTFIIDNIFEAEYDELGIRVTDAELVDMVQGSNIHPQIQQFFTDPNTGQFDRQNVIRFLQQINSAPPQQRASWLSFEATLAPSRRQAKHENLLMISRFANKYEAQREFTETASAEVAYLYVPYFSVSDTLFEVTDEELKQYVQENEAQYQREATRDLSWVQFDIKPSSEDSAFVIEEVNSLYQDLQAADNDSLFAYVNSDGLTPFGTYKPNNFPSFLEDESVELRVGYTSEPQLIGDNYTFFKISDIYEGDEDFVRASHILFQAEDDTDAARSAAESEARRVLRELRNGADFAFMAAQYGTDGTASRGGDLGWFGENSPFDETFKDAVFSFNSTGLLRDVVETDFGFHIIRIDEPESNKVYKIATIEKSLFVSDRTQNEIYRQADLFASQVDSKEEFLLRANEMGISVREINRINPNDQRIGALSNARSVVIWMFNEAEMGDISDVFELENQYVVGMITGIQEEGIADLEVVRSEVLRQVINEKKADYIIENLSALEGAYDDIRIEYGEGARVGAGDVSLGGNVFPGLGIAPKAVGVAFSLEEGESTLPFAEQNGVVMFTVSEKTPLEELEDYEAYRGAVLNSQQFQRMREDPFSLQSVYDALVDAYGVDDKRYRFF